MSRNVISIEQSAIRSPVRAPIRSALNGNPTVRYLSAAFTQVFSPLPIFGVLTNAETPGTPAWHMEWLRTFRTRSFTDGFGSITDSEDALYFTPSSIKTGAYVGFHDDIFDDSYYAGYWDTVTDEFDYATEWTSLLAWAAAQDFSTSTGIWAPTPTVKNYISGVYRFGMGGPVSTDPTPAQFVGSNWSWTTNAIPLSFDVTTIATTVAAYSGGFSPDANIYPLSATEQVPSTSALPAGDYVYTSGSTARVAVNVFFTYEQAYQIYVVRSQIKPHFTSPYFVFEMSGNGADSASNLIRYVGASTSVPETIIDVPVPPFAGSLPALSNGTYLTALKTFVAFTNSDWATFLAANYPLSTEITAW